MQQTGSIIWKNYLLIIESCSQSERQMYDIWDNFHGLDKSKNFYSKDLSCKKTIVNNIHFFVRAKKKIIHSM